MFRTTLLVCLVILSLDGAGQDSTRKKGTFSQRYASVGIFFDQDLWVDVFQLDEDRNYTMGFGLYFASDKLGDHWVTAPIRFLSNSLYKFTLGTEVEQVHGVPYLYSVMLANGSFTPDYLPARGVIANDRPYGNITYFQQNLTRIDPVKLVKHSSSFIIGVLGTYISREVQTEIHSWFNENDTKDPRKPQGWNNQISSGGEPTFLITRSADYLLTKKNFQRQKLGGFSTEVKHGWKYTFGYYTGLQYSLDMRVGLLDPNNWTSEANPLGNSSRALENIQSNKANRAELYLLASSRPVFMLYNAMLNGQFKRSSHTIDFQNTKHLLFEWNFGIAGKIPFSQNSVLDVRWRMISGRTAEFKLPGRNPRAHNWGGIDLVFTRY